MPEVKMISYTQPVEELREELFKPTKKEKEFVYPLERLIAFVARVSNPNNQLSMERNDRKLNDHLMDHKHWSPFDMADVTLEIKTTRDIARQILRHRSFYFQEFSQRYAQVDTAFENAEARLQDTKNRQNSLETEDEKLKIWWEAEQNRLTKAIGVVYKKALENGIAKEVARKILPEGLTVSTLYMKGSIRSWCHYVEVRSEPGTQKEHREVALLCAKEISKVFPQIENFVYKGK